MYIFLVFFLNLSAYAQGYYEGYLNNEKENKYDPQLTNTFLPRLAKYTENSKSQNVEEFLIGLKQEIPELFAQYLLGYRSRSLQNSSMTHPRVIVFPERSALAVAFNGRPEHKGFQNLEVVGFNYETDKFEFYELGFGTRNQSRSLGSVNQKKCLECHQSPRRSDVDPRPNWEPYNQWPGFYGSFSNRIPDNLQSDFDAKYIKSFFPRKEDEIAIQDMYQEKEAYENFFSHIAPEHPRYNLISPYRVKHNDEPLLFNDNFTKEVLRLNLRRVSRLMKQEKDVYEFVKWNVVHRKQCGDLVVPDSVVDYLQKQTGLDLMTKRYTTAMPTFSKMVDIFFTAFGVDTEDWSMDFKTEGGRFAFEERFGSPNQTWNEFGQGYQKYFLTDPDFKDLDCAKLKTQAEARMGNLSAVQKFYETRKKTMTPQTLEKPLVQRCISCHAEKDAKGLIPLIPFDQPQKLASLLQKPGYKRGTLMDEISYRLGAHATIDDQMPPSGGVTRSQREALLDWLQAL